MKEWESFGGMAEGWRPLGERLPLWPWIRPWNRESGGGYLMKELASFGRMAASVALDPTLEPGKRRWVLDERAGILWEKGCLCGPGSDLGTGKAEVGT
jgi:hypothetical protein